MYRIVGMREIYL